MIRLAPLDPQQQTSKQKQKFLRRCREAIMFSLAATSFLRISGWSVSTSLASHGRDTSNRGHRPRRSSRLPLSLVVCPKPHRATCRKRGLPYVEKESEPYVQTGRDRSLFMRETFFVGSHCPRCRKALVSPSAAALYSAVINLRPESHETERSSGHGGTPKNRNGLSSASEN